MPAATKPMLSEAIVLNWLNQHYALTGSLRPLPGERDLNFKFTTEQGLAYVCKIADDSEDLAFLAAQNDALSHLQGHALSATPQSQPTQTGQATTAVHTECGQPYVLRLLSYVPGEVLAKRAPYLQALLRNLGELMGRLTRALEGFDRPAFHYDFDWDLAHGLHIIERDHQLIADKPMRDAVEQIGQAFKQTVSPRLDSLPKSVTHNDANDYNLLAQGDTITGLIDFGDMVYTCTICDLAIALAYATLGSDDPLDTILTMVAAYHKVRPIQPDERAVLLPMVRMRLAVSACMAARQMQQRPNDPYLAISQTPIRKTLPRLITLEEHAVQAQLNEALA